VFREYLASKPLSPSQNRLFQGDLSKNLSTSASTKEAICKLRSTDASFAASLAEAVVILQVILLYQYHVFPETKVPDNLSAIFLESF
jgi:hypothetical protein